MWKDVEELTYMLPMSSIAFVWNPKPSMMAKSHAWSMKPNAFWMSMYAMYISWVVYSRVAINIVLVSLLYVVVKILHGCSGDFYVVHYIW